MMFGSYCVPKAPAAFCTPDPTAVGGSVAAAVTNTHRGGMHAAGAPPQTVLIVMLGGCTYAEMTSLRLALARQPLNMRPVILTTDVVTGTRLLDSFVPPSAHLADADALHTLSTL